LINVNGFKNVFGVLTHLKNSFVSPWVVASKKSNTD
jgi:hypothetical protein